LPPIKAAVDLDGCYNQRAATERRIFPMMAILHAEEVNNLDGAAPNRCSRQCNMMPAV
jgi:hypothetical protein